MSVLVLKNNNLIIPPSANDQFAIKNNYISGNYTARVKSDTASTSNTISVTNHEVFQ